MSINNSGEENTVCHNEIYLKPILFSYDIGVGIINFIYANFGFNTEYEINKNFGKNYGLFNSGINFTFTERDYLRLNYYWNRDNFLNHYYHGWIIKTNITLYDKYGVNTNLYYSNDIKDISVNLGLSYSL